VSIISSITGQSKHKPISSPRTVSLPASFTTLLATLVNIFRLQENLSMATASSPHRVSIVTGANGYLGKAIFIELLKRHGGAANEAQLTAMDSDNNNKQSVTEQTRNTFIGLVQSAIVAAEQTYWDQVCQTISNNQCLDDTTAVNVCIKLYDMLDNGESLRACLN
jgi:hypothetical protein